MTLLPLISLLLHVAVASGTPPTVTLPSGVKIVGATTTTCNRYLSIPFANPPTGTNRWKPPTDTNRNSGTIDGTKYPPLCMQPSDGWNSLNSTYMSEDCLYLNIYTPLTYEPQSLPVLLYIHGGDYLYGGTNDDQLKGCNLLNVTNDVLVVTIQYRLGIFGYLGSDDMRQLDPQKSTGNYGLLDQIQALKWVKKNIGVFGGNSGKVTIFGESAGAGSVTNLLVATGAKHLYHKAIMQSGAFAEWTTKSLVNATAVYNDVVKRSECGVNGKDAVSCLLKKEAKALVALSNEIMAYPDRWTVCRWAPTVDGIVIMDHPSTIVLNNPELINDVPIIYGNNDEEGVSFLSATTLSSSDWIPKNTWTYSDYKSWLTLNFPVHYELIEQEYKTMFIGNDGNDNDQSLSPPRPWFVAQRIVGDFMLFCPGRRSAKALTNVDEPAIPRVHNVYEYMFDHVPIGTSNHGAFHGAEIAFVFNDFKQTNDEGEYQLGQSMAYMWSMFAKFGNPTPSTTNQPPPPPMLENKKWMPFPTYIEMDTVNGGALEFKTNLRSVYCENVWDTIRIETPSEGTNDNNNAKNVSIAVGVGLTLTAMGVLFVVLLFFKYYILQGTTDTGSNRSGEYTTFVDEGNATGGEVGVQQKDEGEVEMKHISLEDVEDSND